jgi:cold shock CspA family protein/energy-coupling factor transporter ATP-binding protein EcfA2
VEPIDVAKALFVKITREDLPAYGDTIISEADVRMKVIDPIFTQVLGWPKGNILLEERAGMGEGKEMKGFIDYKCMIDGLNRMVIEAKRMGRDLGVSPDRSGRYFKLNGPVFNTQAAREGIEQGIRYCGHKSAELACVTNGEEWIIFLGNRRGDGKETLDGVGFAFGGLEEISRHFKRFYDLLSFDAVHAYRFRAEFLDAEGQPARATSFREPPRKPGSRTLLTADKLYDDLERVMISFFQDLRGDEDEEMRRLCFVKTDESRRAEDSLARISEDLRNRVQTLKQDSGSQITKAIEQVKKIKRQEFVLLVGTKGAGKSTFIDRFFDEVIPARVKRDCVVVRVDVGPSGADESSIVSWLNEHLLVAIEQQMFPDRNPTFDELKGMYWKEYDRRSTGSGKPLFESDRTRFDVEFGDYVEKRRIEHPHEYIEHMLHRIVHSDGKVPCLVFDNADHHSIEFQQRVFQYAQSIYSKVLCLTLMPITDKTSWQLSRQGAVQSFFTESFFLPTPPPEQILRKRVEFIQQKIAEEGQTKEGRGYFFGRGLDFSIENIRAFASSAQAVLINRGEVAYWIGSLVNHDIRQALRLTREIMSSPHLRVNELAGAALTHTDTSIDPEHAKLAIIRGKYDIYPSGQHAFVQNVYELNTTFITTPLLGLRILQSLADTYHQHAEGLARYVDITDITEFFSAMNVEPRVTLVWLGELLESGLVWSYDPRYKEIREVVRVEISPSGQQHLDWGLEDWVYMESMMEATNLLDRSACNDIRRLMISDLAVRRRRAIRTFLAYLIEEDSRYCYVPDHSQFAGQIRLKNKLENQIAALAMPARVSGSRRYGRPYGQVAMWDNERQFGFIAPDGGQGVQVYVHVRDIEDENVNELPRGAKVEYDLTMAEKGPRALRVAIID